MTNELYNEIKNAIIDFYGDWTANAIIEVRTKIAPATGETYYRYTVTTEKYYKTGLVNIRPDKKDFEVLHDWGMVISF